MISKEALEEYKRIYKKEFGKEISDAEALEQATKLFRLMEIVYKPMPKKDFEEIQKRRAATDQGS